MNYATDSTIKYIYIYIIIYGLLSQGYVRLAKGPYWWWVQSEYVRVCGVWAAPLCFPSCTTMDHVPCSQCRTCINNGQTAWGGGGLCAMTCKLGALYSMTCKLGPCVFRPANWRPMHYDQETWTPYASHGNQGPSVPWPANWGPICPDVRARPISATWGWWSVLPCKHQASPGHNHYDKKGTMRLSGCGLVSRLAS